MSERLEKINAMFYPKSVAVIGASARAGSVGNDVVKNLVSAYSGTIYPINPKGGEIEGRQAYANLTDVPTDVDLVVVCIPAKAVIGVVEQCKAKNVKGIVVISAGFKETGKEGAAMEKDLAAAVQEAGIPLI